MADARQRLPTSLSGRTKYRVATNSVSFSAQLNERRGASLSEVVKVS